MATEILLMDDVESLGKAGDVVNVADGFARNYLMPQGLAAPVNEGMRRRLAKLKVAREAAERNAVTDAQDLAGRLQNVTVTLAVKVAEGNRLYGSVSANDVVKSLAEQGFKLERAQVQLDDPIKELGTYDIRVHVRGQIDAAIKVVVVEE